MKLFEPRIWMGCVAMGMSTELHIALVLIILTGWAVCSILMSTSFNLAGILVCRVGLGVFEAGFGPAIPLYLCKWVGHSLIPSLN